MRKRTIRTGLMIWTLLSFATAAIAENPHAMKTGNVSPDAAIGVVTRGTRLFYEIKRPGSNGIDLVVRDNSGERKIAGSGAPYEISGFMASPDGGKVAVALAQGDAKTVSLCVYDASTGNQLTAPITAAQVDIAAWSEDSHTLYFAFRRTPGAGDISLMAWNLQLAPATLQTYDADVIAIAMRKNETFLLSRQDAPTAKLLALRTGKPLSAAVELVPARSGRTLDSVSPASDGVYVLAREGSQERLLRIPARANGKIEPAFTQKFIAGCRNCRSFPGLRRNQTSEISIPSEDPIAMILADPLAPGVTIIFEDRTAGLVGLSYKPSTGHFVSGRTVPSM